MYKTIVFIALVLLIYILSSCTPLSSIRIKTAPGQILTSSISSTPSFPNDSTIPETPISTPAPSLFSIKPAQTGAGAPEIKYLRSQAESRGILIGTAVAAAPLKNDPSYAETLSREFNILTPENAMKFAPIHPGKNTYNFNDADTIVNFAELHNIKIHGHTLVWHNSLPAWLTAQNWSREDITAILKEHITTVVGHYSSRVIAWDVVNEAITDNGSLRDDIWSKGIGPDYIEMAFRWAHEADPKALLFYNDYGFESGGKKADAIYELVKGLLKKGVPINGIGLQMHVCSDSCPASKDVAANISRFASLGLQVYITEMDVRIQNPVTPEKLAKQASAYRDMLNVCLSEKNCKAFIMWGFTDKHSWIPASLPGWGSGLIFDEAYQKKPAYDGMIDSLAGKL